MGPLRTRRDAAGGSVLSVSAANELIGPAQTPWEKVFTQTPIGI